MAGSGPSALSTDAPPRPAAEARTRSRRVPQPRTSAAGTRSPARRRRCPPGRGPAVAAVPGSASPRGFSSPPMVGIRCGPPRSAARGEAGLGGCGGRTAGGPGSGGEQQDARRSEYVVRGGHPAVHPLAEDRRDDVHQQAERGDPGRHAGHPLQHPQGRPQSVPCHRATGQARRRPDRCGAPAQCRGPLRLRPDGTAASRSARMPGRNRHRQSPTARWLGSPSTATAATTSAKAPSSFVSHRSCTEPRTDRGGATSTTGTSLLRPAGEHLPRPEDRQPRGGVHFEASTQSLSGVTAGSRAATGDGCRCAHAHVPPAGRTG
jgi:hypothetical protein